MAEALGGRARLRGLERARRREVVRPRAAPVSLRLAARGPFAAVHDRRRRARFRSRNGIRVLHPQGFDSFGLPAENAAFRAESIRARSPSATSSTSRSRCAGWGGRYDWSRELSTHDPEYYRWQQWQFLRFLERGLAYRKAAPVKWCPNDQTVVANEQVHDGRCERCGAEVESRRMEQWFFRITDYAQALLDDLATVDWPDSIKVAQRNWIGRSEGAEVLFRIEEPDEDVPVFTTRPDTLFGATFFVLAPEHELVEAGALDPATRSATTCAARPRRRRRSAPPRRRRRASSPASTRSIP